MSTQARSRWLLVLLLMGFSCVLLNLTAQDFQVDIVPVAPDDVEVRVESETDYYYTLFFGNSVTNLKVPADIDWGQEEVTTLRDSGVLSDGSVTSGFYRVRRVPASNPLDTDNDGIDDAYELDSPILDPLDADDATEDYDLDGFNNLTEYQVNADPMTYDPPPEIRITYPHDGIVLP